MNLSARLPHKNRILASLTAMLLSLGLLTAMADQADAISPKTVVATKTKGIKTIAGLRVNAGPVYLSDVRARFGAPGKTKRTSRSTCEAFYSGIKLLFTSFGGATTCGSLTLQSGIVTKRAWKVTVGSKVYRVGQSSSRIPRNAKKFPYYGYRLASKPFVPGRTGTVFARAPGKRITALPLFIGGAGD